MLVVAVLLAGQIVLLDLLVVGSCFDSGHPGQGSGSHFVWVWGDPVGAILSGYGETQWGT